MDKGRQRNSSGLFLVRLWVSEPDEAEAQWHGRLVHVLSGQAFDFRDWPTLQNLLLEMILEPSATPPLASNTD